ncbi:MAG: SDR family NAD(P)-dependent oxidoreductase [Myxococcota bacterium]
MSVVLVTGCRSGFGLLTAAEAVRRGHVVYAGVRDPDTADALVEATGGEARVVTLDVTDAAHRAAVVDRILADEGRIDALVNNAGRPLGGFLEQLDEDELRALFDVNVFAAWAMTKAVLPAMRAQGSGAVVMVGSMSGRMAFPALGAYAASKFALEGLSEAWRHELAPFGVRVTIVEPGPYATDIWDRNRFVGRHAADADSPYAVLVARIDARLASRAKASAGDPQEVAARICDLIAAPNPAFRHPMGRLSGLRTAAVKLAPFGLLERAVARALR